MSLSVGMLFFSELLSSTPTTAQVIAVENSDKFPAADEMVFSRIQYPWRRTNADGTYTPYNANHDKVKLRINNKGTSTLTVSKLTLSNTAAWKVIPPKSLPIAIGAGSYIDVTVQFVAANLDPRVKVIHNTLTIASNDKSTPSKVVQLHGLFQRAGEGNREPYAQEIINAFNFKTVVGFSHNDGTNDGTAVVPNSDEISTATFSRADGSKPVTVTQMAAYHGCCATVETFKWYPKGSGATTLFTHDPLDGQSLLPRKRYNTSVAQASFSPSGSFGFKVGTADSDRSKNFENRIGLRVWRAKNSSGAIIPNAYIVANDYLGTTATNYDYQDNVYYVTNVKPDGGTQAGVALGAAPSSLDYGSVNKGSSKTLTVNLKNPNSSGGASIKISSVALSGPNKGEFTSGALATTLGPQASTNFNISFKPISKGIKNAAILVYHNAPGSPLRIPLYGIANESGSTISVVKRVKGAADANVTIAGKVWEADKNYRKGSIKLDSQVQPGPIAATDQDVLYQSYLSAASNLAETREEIPVSNGSYYVRLHFAENYFAADGARIFNITIEGQTRLSNFDIHKEVGYRSALVKDFAVTVSDGVLSLKFNPSANRVALCGVEIFRSTSATVANTSASNIEVINPAIEEESSPQIVVYPNPTSGEKISVEATNFTPQEKVSFYIYNQTGQTIEVKSAIADENGAVKTQMATNRRLSSGLYILKGRSLSNEAQTKLVVE